MFNILYRITCISEPVKSFKIPHNRALMGGLLEEEREGAEKRTEKGSEIKSSKCALWPHGSITDGCEPLCGCLDFNLGPLEEQTMLLTTEPSLQLLFFYCQKRATHLLTEGCETGCGCQ